MMTRVTFPNQPFHDEIINFDLSDFTVDDIFDDCVFGKWKGTYVKIHREDFDELMKQDE